MARLVMKFGGTSVADLDKIRNVAKHIEREVKAGHAIAVVVSAMGDETNRLIDLVYSIDEMPDLKEYDSIVSTGEQVTSGLLAIILQHMGIRARSWLGWQIPIRTNQAYSKARIRSIDTEAMLDEMRQGCVAVIPGFQGYSDDNRITTLGRGGSDISAVAIAAALAADRCDIYTDVDGIYTADPRIVPKARRLNEIAYEEMLELASLGSKVLQTRSVELAMKEKIHLQVRSSFKEEFGTLVVNEEEIVEQELIAGVAHNLDEAKITVVGVPDRPGNVMKIFGPLADAHLSVDMIIQNVSHESNKTDVTFTCLRTDLLEAQKTLENLQDDIGFEKILTDSNVCKLSVVGVGMRSHAGVAQTMFKALADRGINIQVISTSEIKISVLIAEEYTELALRSLHTAYGLDKKKSSLEAGA